MSYGSIIIWLYVVMAVNLMCIFFVCGNAEGLVSNLFYPGYNIIVITFDMLANELLQLSCFSDVLLRL